MRLYGEETDLYGGVNGIVDLDGGLLGSWAGGGLHFRAHGGERRTRREERRKRRAESHDARRDALTGVWSELQSPAHMAVTTAIL